MKAFRFAALGVLLAMLPVLAHGQSTSAAIAGRVTDPTKATVPHAKVEVINTGTNLHYETETDNGGSYVVTNLSPGNYRVEVEKQGFKSIVKPDLVLHVQDTVEINFEMVLGSSTETVTVSGGGLNINTTDAAVSTVVDRQFAENLPLNGRSFQTLIYLAPGVVVTPSSLYDGGQFSVNGQRTTANYWTVDGVSANIGISSNAAVANGFGGTLGSFSAQGGTNSLVSVDAMQEFRIQTSTYAPEFGRTPGGQISLVTRSGTNQFHGTLFDYLRNDALDANSWFANQAGLPKPNERQNNFGGTLGGPIRKDKTFFFFSYEGLRLRLPQVAETTVPDLSARQNAVPSMQPFLNAYPLPNGPAAVDAQGNPIPGVAQFNASYSNQGSLNAYSLRVDHRFRDKVTLFGRYNYSPSRIVDRALFSAGSLSSVSPQEVKTQTATLGLIWLLSPTSTNDFRFNYSRVDSASSNYVDTFGGAVPLTSVPIPSPYTTGNASFTFGIISLTNPSYYLGKNTGNIQRQLNLIDGVSLQRGRHALKVGVDYRRLTPQYSPSSYGQDGFFADVPSTDAGNSLVAITFSFTPVTVAFNNLGVFAQDTWKISPRMTATYGLRWDVDFVPYSLNSPSLPSVTGYNLNNLSNLAIAPAGTPIFSTTYGNVAPRIGVAYQLSQNQEWQTVLRGGFGVFYDLASSEVGSTLQGVYPYGAATFLPAAAFPLSPALAAPPAITSPAAGTGNIWAYDPNFKLPYTLEWNFAVEQQLGRLETISASYIGSSGRRLVATTNVNNPSPNFAYAALITNFSASNYNALQVQFQRRLSHGLQVLSSYTWSHSIDDASSGFADGADAINPSLGSRANRASSAFDIRNNFSAALTYDIPSPKIGGFTNMFLGGWSLESIVEAFSAPPVNVFDGLFNQISNVSAEIRPELVAGQPLYLYGSQYPGGKAFSPSAFGAPPTDTTTGSPLRQGDIPRNFLRGFGATQWDFAVHRSFVIHESLKLQFRAEMFNVLNHPNFGQPLGDISNPEFGRSTQILGQSLDQNPGGGSFSSLYQIGGPRSIQLALKLFF